MNIYRYKNYDAEKQIVPIEFEYKVPEVFTLEAPDKDYEIINDEDYLVNFLKEKYILNAENGSDYVFVITAKINLNIQNGLITIEQGTNYANSVNLVINDLKKGYWHTAYYYHDAITPDPALTTIHNDIKEYIKNYVNSKYPEPFKIA